MREDGEKGGLEGRSGRSEGQGEQRAVDWMCGVLGGRLLTMSSLERVVDVPVR